MVLEDPAADANKIVQKEKKRPNTHNYSLSTTPYQPPRSGDLGFATQLEQRGWARRRLGTTAPYLLRAWVMASGPPYNLIKQIRLTEPPGWLDLPASEGSLGPRQEQKPHLQAIAPSLDQDQHPAEVWEAYRTGRGLEDSAL